MRTLSNPVEISAGFFFAFLRNEGGTSTFALKSYYINYSENTSNLHHGIVPPHIMD